MELYSLRAGRYIGYTEFLIFLSLLQLNYSLVQWIDQEGLIKIFLKSVTVSQPADAL